MSTRLLSNAPETDGPDVDVGAVLREVGADSAAPTPTRGMRTRQQHREAEVAALVPHYCSDLIRNQSLHQHEYRMTISNLCSLVESLMMIMMNLRRNHRLRVFGSRQPPTM